MRSSFVFVARLTAAAGALLPLLIASGALAAAPPSPAPAALTTPPALTQPHAPTARMPDASQRIAAFTRPVVRLGPRFAPTVVADASGATGTAHFEVPMRSLVSKGVTAKDFRAEHLTVDVPQPWVDRDGVSVAAQVVGDGRTQRLAFTVPHTTTAMKTAPTVVILRTGSGAATTVQLHNKTFKLDTTDAKIAIEQTATGNQEAEAAKVATQIATLRAQNSPTAIPLGKTLTMMHEEVAEGRARIAELRANPQVTVEKTLQSAPHAASR